MFAFNRDVCPVVGRFSLRIGTKLASPGGRVPFRERHACIEAPIERRAMSFFIRKMSRRAIVRALIVLPALSLFRNQPVVDPGEIVEVNGWILRRSDLA
jgi:hypothetical protein